MNKEFTLNGKEIYTEHLLLRPFDISDLHDFYTFGSEKGLEELCGNPSFKNKNETMALINEFISDDNVFSIIEKETNKCIGCIGFIDYKNIDELKPLDQYQGKRLEYYLEAKSWNKGYTNEIFTKVIDYLFNEIGLDFIIGYYYSINKHFKDIYLDFGFKTVLEEYRPTRRVDDHNQAIQEMATINILIDPNKNIKF